MSNYDLYKARLLANGNNEAESLIEITKDSVNAMFKNNPLYKIITIDTQPYDVLLNNGKKTGSIELLFRPETIIDLGSILDYDGKNYLISEITPSEIYSKALAFKCNNKLIFKDENGVEVITPCYINKGNVQSFLEESGTATFLDPRENIVVWISYNYSVNNIIKQLDKFIINNRTWEVQGVDNASMVDGDKGIIQLSLGVTPSDSATSETSTNDWW